MKCKVFIDKNHEEEVIIYSHRRNALVEQLERLVNAQEVELIGYKEQEAVRLGEEAGTKLLLPMMMMMGVVLMIIVIPAYFSFGGI